MSALLYQTVIFFSDISDFLWYSLVTHGCLKKGAVEKFTDEDVAGSTGSFGMIPVILGTLLVAFLAMCVAIPIGLFSAIYMAEFAQSS